MLLAELVRVRTPDRLTQETENRTMNLEIWIPGLVLLGLVTMSLMFAFVIGCEKV